MKTPGSGTVISNPAWYLLQALISYWGTTDNDGNVAGTTIRCGDLALEPPYDNHALKILSGPSAGQTKDINTHPAGTDTLTVASAFTNVTGAAQQILARTRFVVISKMPAIAEIHGVFTVLPNAPATVEPDTDQDLSISISTVAGIPAAADLTAGTITITRVRAGAEVIIINAAACAVANGRIYYDHNFPAANWQAGDEYKAVFTGQIVTVGATAYALSDIRCKGRVSREAVAPVGVDGKPNVQEVIIYPVAEDAGVTELADDGTNPPYYPPAAHSTNANAEGTPGVAWTEDIDFEQEGTITIISIYAEFEWQTRFLVGAGAGTNSISKIQISRDGGATWVDLTDNFTNPNAAMTARIRAGAGVWVPTIVAGANQLQFRLVHWTDDGGGVSTSEAQIRSNSYIRITYRKS